MARKKKNQISVVVFNDATNSVHNVINALHSVALMNIHQATQCAMIIHNVGKYEICRGEYEEMYELADLLEQSGLIVKIRYI